jgi:DNA polymerase-3 subunit beta
MKFQATGANLKALVDRVALARSDLVIPQIVRITLAPTTKIIAEARGAQCSIVTSTEGVVVDHEKDESIVIQVASLRAVASGFTKDQDVTCETQTKDGSESLIIHGDARRTLYTIPLEDAVDFSMPEIPKNLALFEVAVEDILYLSKHTSFASSGAADGPFDMASIMLELNGGIWKAIATDGRRLALATVPKRKASKGKHLFLVPSPVLAAIHKLAHDDGAEAVVRVSVDASKSHGYFELTHGKIIGQLSTGQFPNYADVIPEVSERSIEIDRKEFLAAVERVTCLCEADDSFRMTFTDTSIDLLCRGSIVTWEAKTSFPISEPGKPIKLGINYRYLIDGLRAADCDKVRLDLIDEKSPLTIRGERRFNYYLMPVMIPEGL